MKLRNELAAGLLLALAAGACAQTGPAPRGGIVDEAIDTFRKQLDLELRPPGAPERPPVQARSSSARLIAVRLRPGDDLLDALQAIARDGQHKALAVVTCAGSLAKASVRFAEQPEATTLTGPFEITSLTGTLSAGSSHVHVGLADGRGQCTGGHLTSGSVVHTTAEVVLVEALDLDFAREPDPATGYRELEVRTRDRAAPARRRPKSR